MVERLRYRRHCLLLVIRPVSIEMRRAVHQPCKVQAQHVTKEAHRQNRQLHIFLPAVDWNNRGDYEASYQLYYCEVPTE